MSAIRHITLASLVLAIISGILTGVSILAVDHDKDPVTGALIDIVAGAAWGSALSNLGLAFRQNARNSRSLIHIDADPSVKEDGCNWDNLDKEIDDWYNSTHPKKSSSGPRFPEDPNKLFPEDYAGLTKVTKPNGNIDFIVEAGESTYKIEYHVKHSGDNHYNGNHYHVLKQAETPKPGKTKPPFFRVPNLDPDTPAQGGTFAPGDLLPTRNNRPNGG